MRRPSIVTLALGGMLLAAAPAWPHHSFAAEFDRNKVVKLQGRVTRMEWVNPHAWIHVEVTKDDGSKEEWMVEGNTPNGLIRRGFTKASLQEGTELLVEGYQAKSGENRMSGSSVTFADGKKLFLGSSAGDEPPEIAPAPGKAKK